MGNELSNTDLPAFKRKPGWGGAVGIAKGYHQRYVNRLDEWGQFQKEHGDKVRLWQMTKQILKKSVTADGISTSHLCQALGVSMTYENAPDTDDEVWDFDEWLHATLELGFDATMQDLADMSGAVNVDFSTDNEFVRFGRELVTRRAAVEVSAQRLIHFMKYGETEEASLPDSGMAEKEHANLDASNQFYADFIKYDLDDQIIIAKELTYGLGNSQSGKDFLANLFEFQQYAIFDPFAFTEVQYFKHSEGKFYSGENAIDQAKSKYITVFTKDPEAYTQTYFTNDLRYKFEENPDIQTDSVPEHLVQLLTQLYSGLIHFHATRTNDTHYMDGVPTDGGTAPNKGESAPNPDPDDVVSKFTEKTLSLFVNDDQIRSMIDDIDWSNTPHDKPDWSKDYLKQGGDQGWGASETKAVASISVVRADAFAGSMDVPSSMWTGQLNFLFSTMGAIAGMSSLFDPGSASTKEQIKNLRSIGYGVTGLSHLESYLPAKFTDEIADINRGAKLVNMGRKASKYLGPVGTLLDGLGVVLSAYDMAYQQARGDYDAAAGYALLGLSGVAGLGATAAGATASASGVGFATTATLGLISGGLIAISLVLGVLGTAVVAWCDESEITEWIRNTRFGTGWSALSKTDILDPTKQTFGYKNLIKGSDGPLGEPDYAQQISSLHSMVRPIGLATVKAGVDSRQGHSGDYPYGKLAIDPYQEGTWDSKSEVEILRDGFLFVRPLPVIKDGSFKIHEAVEGDYLHRISLHDGPQTTDMESKVWARTDSEWKKPLDEHEPNGFFEMVEQFAERDLSHADLDLNIRELKSVTNDHGEEPVISWKGTFWDMAGQGNKIFGWAPADIPHGMDSTIDTELYVEVLYVPPEVADSMRNNPVEIRPRNIPTVTRERMKITVESTPETRQKLEDKTIQYGGYRP